MTLLEAMEIYKKFKRNQVAIYSSGFNGGIIRKKGYQDTQIGISKSNKQLCRG